VSTSNMSPVTKNWDFLAFVNNKGVPPRRDCDPVQERFFPEKFLKLVILMKVLYFRGFLTRFAAYYLQTIFRVALPH